MPRAERQYIETVKYQEIFITATKPLEKGPWLTTDPREKEIVEWFREKGYIPQYKKIPDYYGEYWFLATDEKTGDCISFKRDAGHSSCAVDEIGRFSNWSRETDKHKEMLLRLYQLMKHNKLQ